MRTRLWAIALSFILLMLPVSSSIAETLGPASTYDELRRYLSSANQGDIIQITGTLSADSSVPLSAACSVHLSSADGESATIHHLRLRDASIILTNITLKDSLVVDGTSHIQLASGVSVFGAEQQSGIDFSGSGTLIIDRGCSITGGSESAGISIRHNSGEFYTSIDGNVHGGSGRTGGAGIVISPLSSAGAAMISGSIQGGEGSDHGGHALNLYDLNGNAFVTVDGNLRGGSGVIGGDGIQLVAARDNVSVGIGGKVKGGSGEIYGGDALILMNAEGASAFHLSGAFSGGDASGSDAQPGTSLLLVGDSTAARTHITDCILEDGMQLTAAPLATATPSVPNITPLPEITASVENTESLLAPPQETEFASPSEVPVHTPAPPAKPDPAPESAPSAEPEVTPDLPSEAGSETDFAGEATSSEAF